MNCKELRHRLNDYLDASLDAGSIRDVEAHLASCPSCSDHLRVERLLRERLHELPVPPPPRGFSERVLAAARAARPVPAPAPRPVRLYWAMAASILVSLVTGVLVYDLRHESGQAVVRVQGGAVQRVQLVFNSPSALSGVTMHVGLPDGVELAEYPGVHELTWQADLKAGPNLLALPVIVKGAGGTVLASVTIGGESKQFSVEVEAAAHSGALREDPPTLAEISYPAILRDIIVHA